MHYQRLQQPPLTAPYSATQIRNGNFEYETPWESFVIGGTTYTAVDSSAKGTITSAIPNGVGEGWNTTENSPYQDSLFEVWNANKLPADQNRKFLGANGTYFIEMNANNPACLYQDLATQGGDVIKWTLQHAAGHTQN